MTLDDRLRISDEELRIELNRTRNCSQSNCSSVIRTSNTACTQFEGGMKDLEIILKPQPDTEFWSSLLETEITVMNYLGQITVTIISNLVFCALLGKESYQDPDGTWHLPFFMDSFGGGVICVSRTSQDRKGDTVYKH